MIPRPTEEKLQDIVGKKFDHITIIKRRPDLDYSNGKQIYFMYEYECDCPDKTHGFKRRNELLSLYRNNKRICCRFCSRARKLIEENKNKTFGSLHIIDLAKSRTDSKHKSAQCVCRCDCGEIVICELYKVLGGKYKYCEKCRKQKQRDNAITHNLTGTRIHSIHSGMLKRCNNKNNKYYGGKGVTVCDAWNTPGIPGNPGLCKFARWAYSQGFYEQPLDTPYSELLTIERKDPNGDYCPENCKIIPMRDQSYNKTTSRFIYDGEEKLTHSQFEDKHNLIRGWLDTRIVHGNWSEDAAVYAAKHPELGIHYSPNNKMYKYVNKDGFGALIPTMQNTKLK